MTDRAALAAAYREALRAYLHDSGEAARTRAYELGRRALMSGVGILGVTTFYHDALRASELLTGLDDSLSRAADFFSESLAPFEMTFRGYQEANRSLQQVNRALETQNLELQRAKAAADAANEELESFSYSVAHDLRAPLRHIDGYSQILSERSASTLDDQSKMYLERIQASTTRMDRLIEDLLGLARVSNSDLRARRVNLAALAHAVLNELRLVTADRKVQVAVHEPLHAYGDPHLLRIVLDNLLRNAWKFTSKTEQARIEVGCEPMGPASAPPAGSAAGQPSGPGHAPPSWPVYFVRDNGAGFDAAYADRLFSPFQRLHDQRDFPGTGIGLATVHRIVRRHGGRIWAEGAVGAGATFRWTLPSTSDPPRD